MSRLRHALQGRGRKAMGLFLTNGFPSLENTGPLLRALDTGGADFIELGMPFSDPLAEGLPIQRSSAHALAQGAQMDDAFRIAEAFRKHSDTPLLLMGYLNPVLQYGAGNFCLAARSSGVDGLIIPDLPPEEAHVLTEPARINDLDTVFLVSPNTPDTRVQAIDRHSTGFVYAVTVTGLTGSTLDNRMAAVVPYLRRVRALLTRNPVMAGFGVRTAADARSVCQHADGFIVGSALVHKIEELWSDASLDLAARLTGVEDFARQLSAVVIRETL